MNNGQDLFKTKGENEWHLDTYHYLCKTQCNSDADWLKNLCNIVYVTLFLTNKLRVKIRLTVLNIWWGPGVRAHKNVKTKGSNGPWKFWFISIPDVYKKLFKKKTKNKNISGLKFLLLPGAKWPFIYLFIYLFIYSFIHLLLISIPANH